jgi:predicted secreted protein
MAIRSGRTGDARLRRALADSRSGRVVFLSHCLLNQNTRYLGGATCPGVVVDAIAPYADGGVGIVQMACPEQRTWGGVLKRHFLWLVGHPRAARAGHSLATLGRLYLRMRYRWLARAVVRDIQDYVGNGFEVAGVVGVAGSPSCGVQTTLDLAAALRALGTCARRPVTKDWLNRRVVAAATCPGPGLFVEALTAELARRGLAVPVSEVTLPAGPVPPAHTPRPADRNDQRLREGHRRAPSPPGHSRLGRADTRRMTSPS